MFWIGLIVGMIITISTAAGFFAYCMIAAGVSWDDYTNLVDANKAAIENRDSRVEVYDDDTDEKIFEAEFKYPWSDDLFE